MDSILHTATTELLPLDTDTVVARLREMNDALLDEVIELTDNAATVNRLGRIERGRRTEAYERKVLPGSTFDQTEKNRRSEERTVAAWYDSHDEPLVRVAENGWKKLVGFARGHHVEHNTGDNEWYTPPEYIQAAVDVMGGIDCDPASSVAANKQIAAATFYTAADNGLAQEWHGRVWLNPPYASGLVERFVDKLITEYIAERCTEAIVLTNNASETGWFQRLSIAQAWSAPKGRISYWKPDGESATGLQGQTFHYLGENAEEFVYQFAKFGRAHHL